MPAVLEVPPARAALTRPVIVAPAPREVSFGRISGTVSPTTTRIVVYADGEPLTARAVDSTRFRLRVVLPSRNVTVRVVAFDAGGNRAASAVGPVFGLPRAAAPVATRAHLDATLQTRLRRLARGFPGIAALYVQNLRTGAGAAWNARARFPAASTVKVGIAIEVLRVLPKAPPHGSDLDRLLRSMLVFSSNDAANRLLVWLGGSQAAGAARVNATLEAAGLRDTHLYGGYILGTSATTDRPIPLTVVSQPSFGFGKYTTAWDLARLHRAVHLATAGRGPLVRRLRGFRASDARRLLFTLAHSADHGKLDRYIRATALAVPHKAGWITTARHDAGLVYWRGGVFVASVMAWSGSGVGVAPDVLAGRVAKSALGRFGEPARTNRARASARIRFV